MRLYGVLVLLVLAAHLAAADPVYLDFQECQTYTDSNGTNITFCNAYNWSSAVTNLTYGQNGTCINNETFQAPALPDPRLNMTLYLPENTNYTNESINFSVISYYLNHSDITLEYGQNATDRGRLFKAPLFPTIDERVFRAPGRSWRPYDSRYNVSVNCTAIPENYCARNVTTNITPGAPFFDEFTKTNITCIVPYTNFTVELERGEERHLQQDYCEVSATCEDEIHFVNDPAYMLPNRTCSVTINMSGIEWCIGGPLEYCITEELEQGDFAACLSRVMNATVGDLEQQVTGANEQVSGLQGQIKSLEGQVEGWAAGYNFAIMVFCLIAAALLGFGFFSLFKYLKNRHPSGLPRKKEGAKPGE